MGWGEALIIGISIAIIGYQYEKRQRQKRLDDFLRGEEQAKRLTEMRAEIDRLKDGPSS